MVSNRSLDQPEAANSDDEVKVKISGWKGPGCNCLFCIYLIFNAVNRLELAFASISYFF